MKKRKRKKKSFIFVLLLCTVLTFLTGCSRATLPVEWEEEAILLSPGGYGLGLANEMTANTEGYGV